MSTTIRQVRDVPEPVIATLRERAALAGLSLPAYVRKLLTQEAAQPTMEETLARIAAHEPVEATNEEILAAIRDGRR